MNEEQTAPNNTDPNHTEATAATLVQGVSSVVVTVLDVGAVVAKATAEATAGDRSVPDLRGQTGSLDQIIHYGIASVTNVAGTVIAGVSEARSKATQRTARPPTPDMPTRTDAQRATTPSVHIGATLRIPLSIENPGAEPMDDLQFRCLKMAGGQVDGGDPLTTSAVRFEPERLTIAPRDFEKLTVYIDVPEQAATGRYIATIGAENGLFDVVLTFDVVPPIEHIGER